MDSGTSEQEDNQTVEEWDNGSIGSREIPGSPEKGDGGRHGAKCCPGNLGRIAWVEGGNEAGVSTGPVSSVPRTGFACGLLSPESAGGSSYLAGQSNPGGK